VVIGAVPYDFPLKLQLWSLDPMRHPRPLAVATAQGSQESDDRLTA
jgi:hypothetical protein